MATLQESVCEEGGARAAAMAGAVGGLAYVIGCSRGGCSQVSEPIRLTVDFP